MLQGVAWTVAIMMYSIYTQRLMGSSLPAPPTRPGMFVSVGPAGKYFASNLRCTSPSNKQTRLHRSRPHLARHPIVFSYASKRLQHQR